ncbi:nitric oxide-associated protein 1 [Pholidichthys leucotaenia]
MRAGVSMLKVLHVCVRRQLWRGVRSAAGTTGNTAAERGSRSVTKAGVWTCTVDPNQEEQFVFLDCTDPEEDHHLKEEDLVQQLSASTLPAAPGLHSLHTPAPGPLTDVQIAAQKHLRSLERQLQTLQADALQEKEPDSLIQFHDVDFPLDESVVSAVAKKKKKKKEKGEHKIFGTPDVDEPVSDTCCSGCGAMLHCTDVALPGYLPSEKYKALHQEGRLGVATCQRCHLLTHHHMALNLQMSKDQYRDVVRQIRPHRALVLLIVDLLDLPDSIIADLPELVGTNKHIVVLGNKVDLLPGDSHNYLQRIRRQLSQYCHDAGFGAQVTDIHLISAKTGYGVESLISVLQRSWKYKGDVYLVGGTNVGKSTLFNMLLESDYAKSRASDVIHKATISPWPGTTLNLLKFPIINPTPYRMFRRQERLKEASQQTEEQLSEEELRRLQHFSREGYLVGRVGRTFRSDQSHRKEIEFEPDSLAFSETSDGENTRAAAIPLKEELSHNEVKDAHWLYDTPGIMKERDILNLLSEQEVGLVVATHAVVPRTFVLKPGTSLFVGALARIDFLQGEKSCWFSVVASSQLPVHITSTEKADAVYEKHAGHVLLGVPVGGSERMKDFPPLVPQDIRLKGQGYLEAAADIKLSSAGWVAVTAVEGDQILLRLHGPQEAGFSVRMPPLLPHIISLKGKRIRKSSSYKSVKPAGLLDEGLLATGAEQLRVKEKKKIKGKKKDRLVS